MTPLLRTHLLLAAALLASAPALASGGSATGADLQVSGSASTGSPALGAPFSYTFRIKNSGPETATGVSFSNPMPMGTTYLSGTVNGASAPCLLISNTATCDLGSLANGASATVVINLDAPLFAGNFADTGSAQSSVADGQPLNNSFTVNVTVKASGAVAAPSVLPGPVYLRDSFGYDPPVVGLPFRFDPAGTPVAVSGGELSLNGIRVEWPNIASEVWLTPAVRQQSTWFFGPVSSIDPLTVEPPGSYDRPGENGTTASDVNPSLETNNAALVPFLQPPGAVTASISMIAGWYTTAIGFTPSGALTANFENFGAAWLVLRMPRTTPGGQGSVATWELHTNGLAGPSASGSFVLQGYNHVAVSYDPAAGTVVGSINGVLTPALPYVVSGVAYVGFQGNGIVNDFLVEQGSL